VKALTASAAALFAAVTPLLIALPASATAPGENGRIAFRRYLNEDHTRGALFTARPNGSDIRQLTHPRGKRVTTEPDWSPNGRWIVYTVNWHNLEERARMAKIRRNGTHRTRLSFSCTGRCLFDGFPAWSPSGRRIAFHRALGPPFDAHGDPLIAIFVMRANGTHAHRVTQKGVASSAHTRWEDHAPTWAPSGRRLAFERLDKKLGRQAIFTVRHNGTGLRRITPWWLQAAQPDYSPNGRWVLVRTKQFSDTSGNLWLFSRNGVNRRNVTHAPAGAAKWLSASFSPDGEKIQAGRVPIVAGEQQNSDVWTMDLHGGNMRNITQTPGKWESASDWGPRPR
jgi:TolB protein